VNAVAKQGGFAKVQYSQTQLGGGTNAQGQAFPGGLDLTTPSLRLAPGALHDCLNYEVALFGGYARIDGYERYDGHASPSSAAYTIVQVESFAIQPDFGADFGGDFLIAAYMNVSVGGGFLVPADFTSDFTSDFTILAQSNIPTVGQVVTQAVSGATGTIAAVVTEPASYLVLTQVTGVFDIVHGLTTPGPLAIGTATGRTISISAQSRAIYLAAAADTYRALIQPVPGVGPILGIVAMAFAGVDHLYAFRANAGGTAALLYKASPAGWVLVPYYNLVRFTAGGTANPLDGDTLTQGGVTATIKRVMWQSGAWAGSAVGQFVVTNPAGGNFAAGAATTTSGATLTLSGVQAPITMAAGGRFEFEKANFSGQLITRRIYGCDGVNPCFEFDGDTLAPISTGLSPDRPSHIRFHKNFLFIAQDASIVYCAAGNPFKWSAVDGAGEIATGDTVTGMITLPGSQTTATLGVYLKGNTAFLYGTDPTTFNFVMFNTGIGAVQYSIQNLFDTFFLDDLGVVTLKTTLNWGNFLPTTLTKNILPFIARERGNLTASAVNREKSQYRLFFGDGYALYCTILNQQYLGSGLVLYPDVISCVDTTKLVTDTEATYAGSESGYVHQLDIGTSFDGAAIPAFFVTAWDPVKSPRILKRFRTASIEVQGGSYAAIQYGYQIGYNSSQLAQLPAVEAPFNLGAPAYWDSFVWDNFTWDGSGLFPTDVDQTGTAENIRVVISSGTNYIAAYTVNSIIHHYSMRRGMRV
jgi:hypothetical protein